VNKGEGPIFIRDSSPNASIAGRAIYWELRGEGDGMDVNGTAEVTVWFDAHLFTDDDRQGLEERLEIRFRVESELLAYTYVPTPGELPPPEVFVQLLDYVLPLRDMSPLTLFAQPSTIS
jgi:hypothetical protein